MAESQDLQKLMVLIEANTKSYERAMAKVGLQTEKAMKGAAKSGKVVDLTLKQIENGSGRVGASIARMEADLGKAAMSSVGHLKLNNQQLVNMQAQFNDIGVMLASGQNPFTLIMQQGMQISQIFGPNGSVKAALRATGAGILTFLTNPLNLAIFGIAAASAAIPKIWEAFTGPGAKSAEDTLKGIDDLLAELERSYEGVEAAARKYIDTAQSADVLLALTQKTESELRAGLAKALDDVALKTIAFTGAFGDFDEPIKRGQREIEQLGQQLKEGNITVAQFRDRIADIRLAENTPEQVKRLADNLLEATEEARKLENGLAALAVTAELADKMVEIDIGRFDQDQLSQLEKLADLRDRLRRQADDITGRDARKEISEAQKQREREIATIEREQQAISEYLDSLRLEGELIGATTLEREKALAVRKLGLSATDEQIAATERLIEVNYRLEKSLDDINQAQQFMADTAFNALMGVVEGSKDAEDALKDMAKQLARAALQATLLGQGPLAGVFGTSTDDGSVGGIFGAILGSLFRAKGGPVSGGQPYIVGEKGPELFVPQSAGTVVANQNMPAMGGNTFAPVISVDARGATPGVEQLVRREIDNSLDQFSRLKLPGRVKQINSDKYAIG